MYDEYSAVQRWNFFKKEFLREEKKSLKKAGEFYRDYLKITLYHFLSTLSIWLSSYLRALPKEVALSITF